MDTNDRSNWLLSPKIYIENVRNREQAYFTSSEAVLEKLRLVCEPGEVCCRFSDDCDIEAFHNADILIAGKLDTLRIATEGKALKLIQCTSAGVENYSPFDWLRPNTTLTNASGVHSEKAAEFGLMAVLMLHEGVPSIATNQRAHIWKRELKGMSSERKVLIYGVGALGGAVAARLDKSGFEITGVRRSGDPHPAVSKMVTPDRFHEELEKADILILSCPLTAETKGLMGSAEFELLPPGASLLNIARSGVVNHNALVASLNSGQLSGAILDVFDHEPLPSASPLWDVPNLMVFPHVSSDAPVGYIGRCLDILADNVKRYQTGLPLRNVVNPNRGY